jgi:hypothetical protein
MDFSIFYKSILQTDADWATLPEYDLFISAYDCSERVDHNFNKIRSKEKHWFLTPHYKMAGESPKDGKSFIYNLYHEDDFILEYFKENPLDIKCSICIDITGFIRPFIIFLFRYLHSQGVKKVDCIYAEPIKYVKSEETDFSGFVDIVKTVPGCASTDLLPSSEEDVLIVAVGYDDKLISAVADNKKHCSLKYRIFGFPSLQPDMYQESVLKTHNARESLGTDSITLFSPAFDPFITAQILKETIDNYLSKQKANFYLSPLSTKPQVLGFILYYLYDGIDKPVNIIFPYSNHYSINTCKGVNKTWKYTIEFP